MYVYYMHVHCMYAFVELVLLYTFRGLPDSFSPSVEDDLLWPVLSPPLTSRELISMLALPLLPSLEWSSLDRGGIGGESGGVWPGRHPKIHHHHKEEERMVLP